MGIIKEYNYTPNMIARSLSSKDSFTIGMIIPGVGEKQYGKILEGAAKEQQNMATVLFLWTAKMT